MILDLFARPGISLKTFGAGQGTWAIVTGCTDGIGKEFAVQLAKEGFNIILVSRNTQKLEDVSRIIRDSYDVSTEIYAMDYSKNKQEDFDNLAELIRPLDVRVLINNVGKSHDMPTYFNEESQQNITDIIEINIKSLLYMTKLVVPSMISKSNGLILNVGSFAGLVPTPLLSVYSGSKSFVSTFSQALGCELKKHGIVVQSLNTYFVVTAMSKLSRSNLLAPYPHQYVRAVLRRIGLPCGASSKWTSSPFPSHAVVNKLIDEFLPLSFGIQRNYAMHLDIRSRVLRKREREAAIKTS